MTTIAIFPIPNCVTFPGSIFPLHVFEPRYRQMVRYCLDNQVLLGITHTKSVISEAKVEQSVVEALQSNQATYTPHTIFSAGFCELHEELEDGRLILQVPMEARYRLLQEEQRLPFMLARCEPYEDQPISDELLEEVEQLREKIVARLRVMTSQLAGFQEIINSEEWQNKSLVDFSFSIFGLLQFNADLQQTILEMPSAHQRLSHLLDLLNQ